MESEEVIIQRPDLSAALGPGRYSGIDPSELFMEMAAELEGKEGAALEAAIQAEICRAAVDVGALGLLLANIRALETLDTGVPPESERERCRRALLEHIADLRTLTHEEAVEACRRAADAKDWTAYFATLHGRAERRLYGEVVVDILPMGDPVWREPHLLRSLEFLMGEADGGDGAQVLRAEQSARVMMLLGHGFPWLDDPYWELHAYDDRIANVESAYAALVARTAPERSRRSK